MILLTGESIIGDSNMPVVNAALVQLSDFYSRQRHDTDVVFESKTICSVSRETNSLAFWHQLYAAIVEANPNSYDGIIILHQTGVLEYTATFLSFMLSEVKIPVVLVSGDLPLNNDHANGYDNFLGAVDFLANQRIKGVFVPIHIDGKTYIHLGSRLIQAWPDGHYYKSLNDIYFGIMDENGFHWNKHEYNPTIEELNCKYRPQNRSTYIQNSNIVYIKPYPGLNYDIFDFKVKPVAVFHELYHSGTACTEADTQKYTITYFARKCINEDIAFYAAPFNTKIMSTTSKDMEAAGIKFISNMSVEAAYIKLIIAYGLFTDKCDILDFLNENIFFEKLFQS